MKYLFLLSFVALSSQLLGQAPEQAQQKPTTLTYVKSAIQGEGGAFTFAVKDKDGILIKNKAVTLMEGWAAHKVSFQLASGFEGASLPQPAEPGHPANSTTGTNDQGEITDGPVTCGTFADIESVAQQYYDGNPTGSPANRKLTKAVRKLTHKYWCKYGDQETEVLFVQIQTITIRIDWDVNNKPKAVVESVAPPSPAP